MGGLALYCDPECHDAGVCRDRAQLARLRDYSGVCPVASKDRVESPDTPVLLPDDGLEHHSALEGNAGVDYSLDGVEGGDYAPLHVGGASPVDTSISDGALPRRVPPLRLITGGDDVYVTVDHQAPAFPLAVTSDDADALLALDRHAEGGVAPEPLEVDVPRLNAEADCTHLRRNIPLRGGLLTTHAGEGDQLTQVIHKAVDVDSVEDPHLVVPHMLHGEIPEGVN